MAGYALDKQPSVPARCELGVDGSTVGLMQLTAYSCRDLRLLTQSQRTGYKGRPPTPTFQCDAEEF